MYILEGNIGVGKSTLLKLLEKQLPIEVTQEPVAAWQEKVNGESMLNNFFTDPQRWAYTFETLTMLNRIKDHREQQKNPNPNRILERSLYSGYYCFGRNCYEQGYMHKLEWDLYSQWFNFLVPTTCKVPHGFIYLKCDPSIALERLKKRARSEEKTVSLDYLKQIDSWHDAFLVKKIDVLPELRKVPVLILDCNEEFETNLIKLKQHAQNIEQFMRETQIRAQQQREVQTEF